MTLKAELPVFPEGGIYPPPEPKNQNTPPLAENTPLWKFWSFPLPAVHVYMKIILDIRLWCQMQDKNRQNAKALVMPVEQSTGRADLSTVIVE